ncbi:MAG: hypothetical protein K9L68_04915 [Spirochaetales bacterium]|nr:hypothetical protein [Spirochaetales bacterium]MCF7937919.1 hypothetical protein [Spirochaetales bacterium]
MKYSRVMRERIRRVRVLFKELGYELSEENQNDETFSAAFEDEDGFRGGFYIDQDSKFLEIVFSFAFSGQMGEFLQGRLEEMVKIAYEFGCYINLQKNNGDYNYSIFSKVYYSGLNYYSLRDTLRDFNACVDALKELLTLSDE